jgi:hypothetical protein
MTGSGTVLFFALSIIRFTSELALALDAVIDEHERNRLAFEAHERFVKSGAEIKDVYGNLDN